MDNISVLCRSLVRLSVAHTVLVVYSWCSISVKLTLITVLHDDDGGDDDDDVGNKIISNTFHQPYHFIIIHFDMYLIVS